MSWIMYALAAILTLGVADFFRKLGSSLKDPVFSNLIFQAAAFATALVLFIIYSKKIEYNSQGILYAFIGGIFISIFTAFSFKALSTGPGVSTVMPIMRVGGVVLVAILGIVLLREKLTWNVVVGMILAATGIFLLFSNK